LAISQDALDVFPFNAFETGWFQIMGWLAFVISGVFFQSGE
jgi:hypothetical protein